MTKAEKLIEIAGGWTLKNVGVVAEVEKALKRSFEPWNHSLMLSTGRLQSAQRKGLRVSEDHFECLDRPDSLVALLSGYYDAGDKGEWIDSYCRTYGVYSKNAECLGKYLNMFSSVYDYCDQVYGIDKELTNDMIERGKRPLCSAEDVLEYLDLANRFWDARANSARGRAAIGILQELGSA